MQQPSKIQAQTREDMESDIETWAEYIHEHLYKTRWIHRGLIVFWSGLLISALSFIIEHFLNIPIVQDINGISIAITIIPIITLIAFTFYAIVTENIGQVLEEFQTNKEELRKARQQFSKLQHQLKQYNEQIANQLPTLEQHTERLPAYIAEYRHQANYYRRRFIFMQALIILLSASITSLSGGWLDRYITLLWIVPVFSGLISILTSFTLFLKYREKSVYLQETGDTMDLDFKACGLGIGPYEGLTEDKKLILLATRTEAMRKDQLQRQQQLEQSSQNEPKDAP